MSLKIPSLFLAFGPCATPRYPERRLESGWAKWLCIHCHSERTMGWWPADERAAYLGEVDVLETAAAAEEEEEGEWEV